MFGNAVGNAIVAGRVQAADDALREKQLAQFSQDVTKGAENIGSDASKAITKEAQRRTQQGLELDTSPKPQSVSRSQSSSSPSNKGYVDLSAGALLLENSQIDFSGLSQIPMKGLNDYLADIREEEYFQALMAAPLSTRENPQSLYPAQLAAVNYVATQTLSLQRDPAFSIDDLTHYERLHHDMLIEQELTLDALPKASPYTDEQRYAQRMLDEQKGQFFKGQRWDLRVADGINDGVMLATLGYSPMTLVAGQFAYDTVDAGLSIYQNRDVVSSIWREAQQNRGFTLAAGGTTGFNWGLKGDGAIGGFLSVDFNDFDLSGGMYWSFEGGGAVSLPTSMPSLKLDHGFETTIFTSSDYGGALDGLYGIGGADLQFYSKSYDFSLIKADKGNINGYQFTKGKSESASISIQGKFGYGGILWDL